MTKIAVVYGSSRPSSVGKNVASWFVSKLQVPAGVELEMVDLADVNLPLIAEPKSPMMGDYQLDVTKRWAEKVSSYDGFIFAVAEYNLGYTPILKNAIDYLYAEWEGKKVALISYGAYPKSTAVEQLRVVLSPLKVDLKDVSLHASPVWEAIAEDGSVDESKVTGDSPQTILEALL